MPGRAITAVVTPSVVQGKLLQRRLRPVGHNQQVFSQKWSLL
ncbi:hypothetical protein AEST_24650 [Alishewanella aestuarii B11]|uniref:Uncharacterized protein n=1 Tax=Alishewanella aestuarii B11 TaxID=1197174 RepID=J1YAF7_9ALTE|nr:hypothetical protein AEST_24650 [Alishewanella aestuarii B11]